MSILWGKSSLANNRRFSNIKMSQCNSKVNKNNFKMYNSQKIFMWLWRISYASISLKIITDLLKGRLANVISHYLCLICLALIAQNHALCVGNFVPHEK